jgi:hypothetical protein
VAELDTETESQIAALEADLVILTAAANSGTLSVRHGDTMIQYQSLDLMMKRISAIKREIRKLRGESRGPTYALQMTKGL